MSTIKPRKNAAVKKASGRKAVAKKAVAKKVAAKKPVATASAASSPPTKTAKKTATKTTKAAAQRATPRPAVKKASASTARAGTRSTARRAASKTAARPPAAGKQDAAARKASGAPRPSNRNGGQKPVSPKVAARHFREVLQAKQERVRQGPNYPPANAFTGQRAAEAGTLSGGLDPHAPLPATGTPAPEALTGANSTHGRGNQGMRKQK